MSNFVPHEQYQENLRMQVERIDGYRSEYRYQRVLYAGLWNALVTGGAGLLAFWAGFWLIDVRGHDHGHPLMIGATMVLTGVVALSAQRFFFDHMRKQPHYVRKKHFSLKCPHCAEFFHLNAPYECGWCGHEEIDKNLILGHLATEPCKSCDKRAVALNCPCCSNDIALDLEGYNQSAQQDYGYAGTTTHLQPRTEN